MLKFKRTALLTTAFMLSFSPVAFGMTGSGSNFPSKTNLPTVELQKPVRNLPERLVNPENPDEKVRIIVELDNAPTIEKATKKGVLYKQLNSSERKKLEAVVTDEQVEVQEDITETAPTIDYLENFTTVFNGFSAEVEAKYVDEIAETSGVKAVYESTEYERPIEKPEMIYSKELVQAQRAWNDYGKTGEGMIVGIIDTGIDPNHKDMVLSEDTTIDLTKDKVNELLGNGAIINGKYFTAKVPFGYNYMDKNNQILDLGPDASMHGMHVAGTVGANGDEEKGGIKGVAPEAQLLALKVFGNDPGFPSTYGDVYVKAIDDSIKLGADVINMSLGSTAGYVDANNPEQQAVKRATDNGVLVSISAGNSALYGDGYFYPYTENQDYGLTGSPSVSYDSLGVASLENSTLTAYSFKIDIAGEDGGRALYLLANNADPLDKFKGELEIVDAGFGKVADFTGKNVKGKVALISRGEISFVEKGLAAQAAGAAGVIVYNNTAGTINMASDPAIQIPFMSILQEDGLAMKAAYNAGKKVTISYDGQFTNTQNPEKGSMSSFSSWGPTPNLDFKPEITAPGGNIFSTLNDDKYGLMSGTSMAAPHVSGGAALILQRVDEDFGVTNSDRVQLAKNLLMNTAKPVVFAEYQSGTVEYVSPRRQGSGLMQLANALKTDVVVTETSTGEAKVALKEIKDNKFSFTLKAKNFSDEDKTYNVNTQVQMDVPANAGGGLFVNDPNNDGQFVLTEDDIEVTSPENITIPASGTKEITVSVDVSFMADMFASIYSNGFFVDGFVTLTDTEEDVTGNVPLTVPFFGFNGEWDDAPIFDYFAWDPMTYWGMSALADEQGEFIDGGGDFDTSRFGFSPNNDGVRDLAIPVFSLFRNAKEFKVEVLDSEGKKLRTIRTAKNLTKHYISTNYYTYNPSYGWDGKINNKPATDGEYFIQLSGVIDFEGAEWQSIKFPVKVDTVAPTADVSFDAETKTVSVANLVDNEGGTGANYWEILVNGKVVADELSADESEAVVESMTSKDVGKVIVWDAAGNNTEYTFKMEESTHPVIFIDSPEFFDAYDTNQVEVKGHVEDDSNIKTFTINGEEVVLDGNNFSHTLTLDNGVQDITVAAEDDFGNIMQITRTIFVDSLKPEITLNNIVDGTEYSMDDPNPVASLTVSDNFDEVRVYLNGSEVFFNELSEPYEMNGYENTIDVEIPLLIGKNEYVFEVVDLVGHSNTTKIELSKYGKALEVNKPSVSLKVDDTEQLVVTNASYSEEGVKEATNVTETAEYSGYDKDVITVESGLITAKATGSTEITIKDGDLETTVSVTVVAKDVISYSFNKNSLDLEVGDTEKLVVKETTTSADGKSTVKDVTSQTSFTSTDTEVITVEGASITAIGAGTATIKAIYNGTEVGEVSVNVSEVPDKITLEVDKSNLALTTGATSQLTVKEVTTPATGEPTDVDVTKDASYTVGDNKIVSVVEGLVTAKAKGETTITIKHGEQEAVVNVKVEDPVVSNPGNGGSVPSNPTPPTIPAPTQPADPSTVVVDDKNVDEQVKDTKATNVEVTVPAPTADKPKVNAEVSATALKAIADSGKAFVVKAGDTGLTVPSEVLKEIAKNSGKTNIEINLDKDAKVPGIGTSVSSVYEFTITVEKDGKSSTVSTFSKPVEVTVPVNTSTVKDADKVAAYYVNEKTNALEYVGSKYKNGKVTFKTNHFSKFVVVENNKTFKDLENSWAKDFIESLASKTIIKGKTEDTFAPNDQITRAQFALLLTRSLNLPKAEYQGTFSDVAEDMAYSVYEIEAANRAGIIVGSEGKFNPNQPITRQQMATMIIRAIQYENAAALKGVTGKVTFADEAKIGDYAKENVALAAELGIISGKEVNGKQVFAPLENATRAQASKMLYYLLEQF